MTHTVAILTGASRGIAAMARQLAKPGTRLITLARREDPELAARARPGRAAGAAGRGPVRPARRRTGRRTDLRRAAARRQALLLINNAGTVHPVSGTDADRRPGHRLGLQPERHRRHAADRALPGRGRGPSGRPPRAEHLVRRGPQSQRRLGRVLRHQGGAGHVLARGQAGTGRDRRARRLAGARHRRHRHAVAIRSSDPAHFPALSKFQEFHATGKLSSPANVATRILAYLDRDDFGTTEIDDIRNYD